MAPGAGRVLPAPAPRAFATRAFGCPPLLSPVLGLLAATAWLDRDTQWTVVLAAVVLLGVPHGALDGEIARPLLRPRFGWAWFGVFALPYLGLSACVLAAWRIAPMATLGAFLAGSAWHFGREEDAGPNPLEALARGGLPIALPVLLHPAATAEVLGTVALTPLTRLPEWLFAGVALWCVAALWWTARMVAAGRWQALTEPGLLAMLFVALPPLPAFAIYFVCIHAPRHTAALLDDPRAPRVVDMRAAILRSLPTTALTVAIGAALWRWFPGTPSERLLALTIQGLAALTLPHVILDQLAASRWHSRQQ